MLSLTQTSRCVKEQVFRRCQGTGVGEVLFREQVLQMRCWRAGFAGVGVRAGRICWNAVVVEQVRGT